MAEYSDSSSTSEDSFSTSVRCEECRIKFKKNPAQRPRTCQKCHHCSACHKRGRFHICPKPKKCTKWDKCPTSYEAGHKQEVKEIKRMEKREKMKKNSFLNPDLAQDLKGKGSEEQRAIVLIFFIFTYF